MKIKMDRFKMEHQLGAKIADQYSQRLNAMEFAYVCHSVATIFIIFAL